MKKLIFTAVIIGSVFGLTSALASTNEPSPTSDDSFHSVESAKSKSSEAHAGGVHSAHAEHGSEGEVTHHEGAEEAGHEAMHGGHNVEHEAGHEGGHGGHEGGHNHFAGTFAFITDESKSTNANISGGPSFLSGVSKSEVSPSGAIGVNFALSPTRTFGVVLSGDLKKGEYGSYESESATVKLDENSHFEIALEPGVVFAPKVLGFLIFGVHQASVKAETSFNGVDANETKNMTGYSIGFGSKVVLAEHVFGVFEYQHLKYMGLDISNIRISPSSDAFALGLGYHF